MNQARQTDPLNVRVLGPLLAFRHHEQVDLGPLRQQAVLLPLVLRPGSIVSREEILDGVWGEALPDSGIALVRSYISRLRRSLGRDVIGRCASCYFIRLDPGQVDLTAFDQRVTKDSDASGAALAGR